MFAADELALQHGPITFSNITAFRIAIAMHEPFRISSGEVLTKDAILLKVSGGDAFGWGESSAMPGGFYSADTPESCERELVEKILPALAGRTFPNMGALERFLRETATSNFVRVAVETAAWELIARRQGVSLRKLFGIADRPIPSGLAIGLYEKSGDLHSAIKRYLEPGFLRLKIKIKRGHDIGPVECCRRWFPDMPLFVDANADYSHSDFAVFEQLEKYGLMMFEQPFGKDDLKTAAELQRRVTTPVCLDEGVECAEDARRALEMRACGIVNIKLQRVGGFLEALRIIEVCAAQNVPVWMGTMPELGVGSAQALVLAAHPSCRFPTDVEPSQRWYTGDVLLPELALRDGALHVPPGPGLGFSIDEKKIERLASARWAF